MSGFRRYVEEMYKNTLPYVQKTMERRSILSLISDRSSRYYTELFDRSFFEIYYSYEQFKKDVRVEGEDEWDAGIVAWLIKVSSYALNLFICFLSENINGVLEKEYREKPQSFNECILHRLLRMINIQCTFYLHRFGQNPLLFSSHVSVGIMMQLIQNILNTQAFVKNITIETATKRYFVKQGEDWYVDLDKDVEDTIKKLTTFVIPVFTQWFPYVTSTFNRFIGGCRRSERTFHQHYKFLMFFARSYMIITNKLVHLYENIELFGCSYDHIASDYFELLSCLSFYSPVNAEVRDLHDLVMSYMKSFQECCSLRLMPNIMNDITNRLTTISASKRLYELYTNDCMNYLMTAEKQQLYFQTPMKRVRRPNTNNPIFIAEAQKAKKENERIVNNNNRGREGEVEEEEESSTKEEEEEEIKIKKKKEEKKRTITTTITKRKRTGGAGGKKKKTTTTPKKDDGSILKHIQKRTLDNISSIKSST